MRTISTIPVAIELFAVKQNCAILTDDDGDIAIQTRFYDDEEKQVVRHRPDPCHFHDPEKWLMALSKDMAMAFVC